MGRVSRSVLLASIALGIGLRIRQYAACTSYWYDEAYVLLNVFHKSFVDLLGSLTEDQAAPPLFLWLLRGLYQLRDGSEWWMRLPALAASVAGLLVMVPLSRRIAGPLTLPSPPAEGEGIFSFPSPPAEGEGIFSFPSPPAEGEGIFSFPSPPAGGEGRVRGCGGLWAVAFCALGHHAVGHAGEVKPYTLDLLMSEAILLSAVYCQLPVRKLWPRMLLCLLAVLTPWASYPSVFVFSAAIASLLVDALRRWPAAQARRKFVFVCTAAGLFGLSCLGLWWLSIRHQATATLRTFWDSSFLDLSSASAAAAWIGRCLIEIGNYGTREMGLPLVLLALVGAVSLRRRPARLVLLIGPLVLALLASALRFYPLGGRLLFFLTPCLWLLAARGITVLSRRLPMRMTWLGWMLPVALLLPALLWAGRLLVTVTPRCQFREAFAYVEARRAPGDALWVSHPQVYEVYHGCTPDLSAYSSPVQVEQTARSGRLWMVCAVAGSHQRYTAADTVARVKAASCAVLDCRHFRGLEVVLYGPPLKISSSRPSSP